MKLKAYTVVDVTCDPAEGNAVLFFAHTEREAQRHGEYIFGQDAEIKVARAPQVDSYAANHVKPFECANDATCAAAGLVPDGWCRCACCDEITDTFDEDDVCRDCQAEDAAP